jgi:hypothetical protein
MSTCLERDFMATREESHERIAKYLREGQIVGVQNSANGLATAQEIQNFLVQTHFEDDPFWVKICTFDRPDSGVLRDLLYMRLQAEKALALLFVIHEGGSSAVLFSMLRSIDEQLGRADRFKVVISEGELSHAQSEAGAVTIITEDVD